MGQESPEKGTAEIISFDLNLPEHADISGIKFTTESSKSKTSDDHPMAFYSLGMELQDGRHFSKVCYGLDIMNFPAGKRLQFNNKGVVVAELTAKQIKDLREAAIPLKAYMQALIDKPEAVVDSSGNVDFKLFMEDQRGQAAIKAAGGGAIGVMAILGKNLLPALQAMPNVPNNTMPAATPAPLLGPLIPMFPFLKPSGPAHNP